MRYFYRGLMLVGVLMLVVACRQQAADLSALFKSQPVTAYQCDGDQKIMVTYLNQQTNDLAWLTRADKPGQLFVNVLSASGAKYVAGSEVWWTKGNEATLTDISRPDYSLTCHQVK